MEKIDANTIIQIISNQKEYENTDEAKERNMLRQRAIKSDQDIEKLVKKINKYLSLQEEIIDMVGPFSDSNLKYAGFAIISAFNLSDAPFHKI